MLPWPALLAFDDLSAWAQSEVHTPMATRAPTPEHQAMHTELGQCVRVALDDLPPECRLTVLLADVEGYSYQEIATIMQCPRGTYYA